MPPRLPEPALEEIEAVVRSVVARYSFRNLLAIIIAAFGSGAWATKVQLDLMDTRAGLSEERQTNIDRVKEWGLWRADISNKVAEHEWNINAHGARLDLLEKRP